MLPVNQTTFGEEGNCFSACIASFLGVDIDAVPNFADSTEWHKSLNEWLSQYGYHFIECTLPPDAEWKIHYFGYHIITGESPRGQRHAVIGLNGEIYHDPHPSNYGLLNENRLYGFLIPTWKKDKEAADGQG